MRKKYVVELTKEEREYLHKLISAGSAPARKLNRARILLKADVGKNTQRGPGTLIDRQIAQIDARDLHSHCTKGTRTLLRGRTPGCAGTL
jgi:hypothetical protein